MLVRLRWLVEATVLGSLVEFLVSYLFIPRYSASAVLDVRDDLSWQCRGRELPDKSCFQHKLTNDLQQVSLLKKSSFAPNGQNLGDRKCLEN
jgi:hypothetical protein